MVQKKLVLTEDLDGSKTFNGKRGYAVTPKQHTIISFIHQELGIKFKGTNSKQAYKFIGEYYDRARKNARLNGRRVI